MDFLLDTNVIVDFFRKRKGSDRLLLEIAGKGKLSISIITHAELLYGTYRATNPKHEVEKLKGFSHDFQIQILPLDKRCAEIYAQAKYLLEKGGGCLDEFDLLIASSAVAFKHSLVTRNIKHFQRFPHLSLFNLD